MVEFVETRVAILKIPVYLCFSTYFENSCDKAKNLSLKKVKALTPIQNKLAELFDYQKRFKAKYRDSSRLKLISVVVLGLEG